MTSLTSLPCTEFKFSVALPPHVDHSITYGLLGTQATSTFTQLLSPVMCCVQLYVYWRKRRLIVGCYGGANHWQSTGCRGDRKSMLGMWARTTRTCLQSWWLQTDTNNHSFPRCGHSSGAVWESRWTSWAVRPNEPSGFRGRKDLLHRASALVTTCP